MCLDSPVSFHLLLSQKNDPWFRSFKLETS